MGSYHSLHKAPLAVLLMLSFLLPAKTSVFADNTRINEWGLGTSTHLRLGIEAVPAALQQARELGFTWVREQMPWSEIEPKAGEFRFSYSVNSLNRDFDRLVEDVDAQGLKLLVVLDGGPLYLAHAAPDQPVDEDLLLEAWKRYVEILADRYGQQVDGWEIGSSVNTAAGWGRFMFPSGGNALPDPALFDKLLRIAERAFHDANPAARIILGGLELSSSNGCPLPPAYFLNQLAALGAWHSFDVVSLNASRAPLPLESGVLPATDCTTALTFEGDTAAIQALFEKEGDKPVWVTSFSWSQGRLQSLADAYGCSTDGLQTEQVLRSVISAISQPGVSMVFAASQADPVGKSGYALTPLTLTALSQLMAELNGALPLGRVENGVFEYRFRTGANQSVYAWVDGCGNLVFPFISSGWTDWKLTVYDQAGNGMPVSVDEDGNAVATVGSYPSLMQASPASFMSRLSLSLEDTLNGWKESALRSLGGWADEQRVVLRQKGSALLEQGKERAASWFKQLILDLVEDL